MTIQAKLDIIRANCVSIIRQALAETGDPVRYEGSEADGRWGVCIHPDESITLVDYAEGAYPGVTLDTLPIRELGPLVEVACEMLDVFDASSHEWL